MKPSIESWWYTRDQRTRVALAALFALILCASATLAMSALTGTGLAPASSTPAPLASETSTPSAGTASPVSTPTTVVTLTPTQTPVPTPTDTPEPTPTPPPPEDPPGDVTAYESGEPVDNPPPGIDIHTASLSADLHVALESGQNPPAELAGWAADDEMLLWMTLYEAIPDPPETYVEWLFALDLDGDAETGRPQGSARINPDLGMEAAIGAYYNPSAAAPYGAFLWIWDPDLQGLVPKHGPVRFTFGDSRALVGLAIPLASFTDMVANTAGVTIVPENVKGRAAALHGTEGSRTIDFYPDRPGS